MTPCPPNIAAWIAQDPARRLWHPGGLVVWNHSSGVGVQVNWAATSTKPANRVILRARPDDTGVHAVMVGALLAVVVDAAEQHERAAASYAALAAEQRVIESELLASIAI